jgi:hypothetical protein
LTPMTASPRSLWPLPGPSGMDPDFSA